MSRCTCVRGADILCRYCESRMEAAESRAEYVDDRMGDEYAERMAGGGWE